MNSFKRKTALLLALAACLAAGLFHLVRGPVPAVAYAQASAPSSGTSPLLMTDPVTKTLALPQWAMFKRDPGRTGRSPYAGPRSANLLWSLGGTGFHIQSSPAMGSDGTIYVGSDEGLFHAINPDGSVKWSYPTGAYITASPAIGQDGAIYIASETGVLYAFNPDGTVKWQYDMGGYAGPSASPLIGLQGIVYAGNQDGLHAFAADGTLLWRRPIDNYSGGPPAQAANGTIYVPSNLRLYVLHPDGGIIQWQFLPPGYNFGSAPAVAPDGTIYANTHENRLYAVTPEGTVKWHYNFGSIVVDVPSSPAIDADGTVYVGLGSVSPYGGAVMAFYPDGTPKWTYWTNTYHSAPSIDRNGIVYIGGGDGNVRVFSRQGFLLATVKVGYYVRSALTIGNGRLYVGSWNGLFAYGDQ